MEAAGETANEVRPGTLAEVVIETVRLWMTFKPSMADRRVLADAVSALLCV